MVLVSLMKQLLKEGKSSSQPRLSILKNLVDMTDSQIDFIIDLYSKARGLTSNQIDFLTELYDKACTGKLGDDIAASRVLVYSAPETARPLPSQKVSGGEEKGTQCRRNDHSMGACGARSTIKAKVKDKDPCSLLYVFNLPCGATGQLVRRVFGTYGQIDDVQVMLWRSPKTARSCATVLFSNCSEADACVARMDKGFEMKRGDGYLDVTKGPPGVALAMV